MSSIPLRESAHRGRSFDAPPVKRLFVCRCEARCPSGMVFRCVRSLRILLLLIVTGLACGALRAQTADRITQEVDPAQSIALPHHHPLWANAANDAGLVSPSLPLEHLTLVLARSPGSSWPLRPFWPTSKIPLRPAIITGSLPPR